MTKSPKNEAIRTIFPYGRWRMKMVMWVAKAPVKISMRFTSDDASAMGVFENSVISVSNTSIIRHFDSRAVGSNFSFFLDNSVPGVCSVTSIVRATTNNGDPYALWVMAEENGQPILSVYDDDGNVINLANSGGWCLVRSNMRSSARKFANWGIKIN